MENNGLDALKRAFEYISEPLLLVSENGILFSNSEAEAILRKVMGSVTLPEEMSLPEKKCMQYSEYIGIDGARMFAAIWDIGPAFAVSLKTDTDRDKTADVLRSMTDGLRMPLSYVYSCVHSLLGEIGKEGVKTQPYTGVLIKNLFRLMRILGNAEELLKFEKEKPGEEKEYEDISFLIKEILDKTAPLLRHIGLRIDYSGPEKCTQTLIYRKTLILALYNLVSNAAEHSGEGDVIRINVTETQTKISIAVSDQGDGVPPEKLLNITRIMPIISTDKIVKSGAGLGLALARKTAQLHNGTTMVDSRPGKGTTVTLSLEKTRQNGLVLRQRTQIDFDHGMLDPRIAFSEFLPGELYTEETF